jgi:hypothetical protein
MTINVKVEPRQDKRFDIHVADDHGHELLYSSQGYENVEDAVMIVRRLFGPVKMSGELQTVNLTVQFRDGREHTEKIR